MRSKASTATMGAGMAGIRDGIWPDIVTNWQTGHSLAEDRVATMITFPLAQGEQHESTGVDRHRPAERLLPRRRFPAVEHRRDLGERVGRRRPRPRQGCAGDP